MGNRSSNKGIFLAILALIALSQDVGRTQEKADKASPAKPSRTSAGPINPDDLDVAGTPPRLALMLRHYRATEDLESAGRLFRRMFPADAAPDPAASAKLAHASLPERSGGASDDRKATSGSAETSPIFNSPEHERNPSADLWRPLSGSPAILAAAEQWAGELPRDIRIRRSTDGGLSWPDTMTVGDGLPWTRPSLRQIAADAVGMAFVKEWEGGEGDIYFLRLSPDLKTEAEFPVALSPDDQRCPSLASDHRAFSAPYVYIVYAEDRGPIRSIMFRISQDLGATWSRAATLASFSRPEGTGPETAIAFDRDLAALHVAWTCPRGSSAGIAVATSMDFGASWSKPVCVTTSESGPASSPSVAAGGGTVIVVYESEAGAAGRDIGLAVSTDSGRRWKRGGSLASSAAKERFPAVRVSEGADPRRFFAFYVEDDSRIVLAGCDAADPFSWTIEKTIRDGTDAVDAGPAEVLPMAGSGGEERANAVWPVRNPDYDVNFGRGGAPDETSTDGVLSLTPAMGLTSAGPAGGPFAPTRISYTVRNTGGTALSWRADHSAAWVTVSSASGTLGPGESSTVEVSINDAASGLPADEYSDEVIFTNIATGSISATRTVILPVSLATMTVTPSNQNVSYAAGTTTFAVAKSGAGKVDWTAAVTSGETWLSIQSGGAGTNAGTITAAFTANPNPTTRIGSIKVTPIDPTIPAVTVTVTQAGIPLLAVTPLDGLLSEGNLGGPFSPSSKAYTIQNAGGTALTWTAAATQAWLTVSPASGSLDPGAAATVTVVIGTGANTLAAGAYADTVTFTNTTNGTGTTTRPVGLTVNVGPGTLSVTPAEGFASSGPVGGPFAPASKAYTLTNTGGTAISWTAAGTQAWLAVTPASGSLSPGATATVTALIGAAANALTAATYNDTVTFTNTVNGTGTTTRTVTLTVTALPGALSVTPAEGLASSGNVGGPFTPASQAYTLSNTGGSALLWTAAATQAWLSVTPASGTLDPGATATVTVAINTTANTLAAGIYNDSVTFANVTNTTSTTRAVTLTVTALPGALSVTPTEGLTSSGYVGGPFTPASQVYTLTNTGGTAISWTAAGTQAWLSVNPASGSLNPAAAATVTVAVNTTANSLAAATYNDIVTFTNTVNGTGTTTRAVTLTVTALPGALSVTPAEGFASTGPPGGPFAPASQAYTLTNTGGTAISWTAAGTQAWLSVAPASGSLNPAATVTVTVAIGTAANTLTAGTYNDIVTFTNTVNGTGNTTRTATLTVTPPGVLSVTPAGGLSSTGPVGGPFSPASQAYTLTNTGGSAISWTATATQTWISVSPASGSLNPAATATVTVAINTTANSLAAGTYNETVTFTDVTNGTGTATRTVTLTVTPPGVLSVTPAESLTSTGPVGGPFTPASQVYTLMNSGGTAIPWTAAGTQTWLSVSPASGTLGPGATAAVTVAIGPAANTLAAAAYNDTVTFTNVTSATATTRTVTLTVTTPGVLTVTPTGGFTSAGTVGGPFVPASQVYTLTNTGGAAISWTAAGTQTWLSVTPASGTLNPGATAAVTVAIGPAANTLAAAAYNDTVTFANTTNGTGTATRTVTLTITTPGVLTVTPTEGLASTGPVGGPFSPASQAYTLTNTGGTALAWTATRTQTWTSLSQTSGTLNPGLTAIVTVSIGAEAASLPAATYGDTVTFNDTTNGTGIAIRTVTLTVTPPGALSVTPAGGLNSAGNVGGPFAPVSQAFTLTNTGGTAIAWTAAKTQTWTTLSQTSGTLNPGTAVTVTVSINTWANALGPGVYQDTTTFTNTTNGSGNTIRSVTLTVSLSPALTVAPANRDVAFIAGTTTFDVSNAGGGTLEWTAAVVAGGDWLSILSGASGVNAGTITASYSANRLAPSRVGIIRVTAAGATGSPKDMAVTQSGGSVVLGLTGQRLVEKAWIVQREYGKLTLVIDNPASVPVDRYVIYRRTGSQAMTVLQQVGGSSITSSPWTYSDAFLQTGTSYTYRISAFDALGNLISESNEITI